MSTSSDDEGLSILEEEAMLEDDMQGGGFISEEEEEEDMRVIDPDDNPAHKFLEYKTGLDLGILREFLEEGSSRTLAECIDKLNEFVVQVMDSPTSSVSFQVLIEGEEGITWKTVSRVILGAMVEGFSVEVQKEVKGKLQTKLISVSSEYFKSLDRNWVKFMTYDPSKIPGVHEHKFLNTFMGFPFHNCYHPLYSSSDHQAAMKVIEVIVFHLYHVLCRGNKKIYNFVKKWLRVVRQHPEFRPEVVLIFMGEEGTGKSQFFKYFAKLFGNNAVYLAEPKALLAKFAGNQMDNKVLICCDEANFKDKEFGPRLKNLVTAEQRHFEKKGVDAKQIKNYLNGIFTTNNKNCLPVDSGRNRRYFPVEVDPEYKDNQAYFDELERHIDNLFGMSVFDFWLRCVKVPAKRLQPPVTSELNDMKMSAMSHLHNWWLQLIDDGRHISSSCLVPGTYKFDNDWIMAPVDILQLHAMYQIANPRNSLRRGDFVLRMRELLPKDGVSFSNENIKEGILPPLHICKEFIQKKLGIKSGDNFIGTEKNERKRKRWQTTIPQFFNATAKRASRSPSPQ